MNAFERLKENYVPQKVPSLNDEQMEWFRRDKFGMFIHWGLYALLGRGEWVKFNEQIVWENMRNWLTVSTHRDIIRLSRRERRKRQACVIWS